MAKVKTIEEFTLLVREIAKDLLIPHRVEVFCEYDQTMELKLFVRVNALIPKEVNHGDTLTYPNCFQAFFGDNFKLDTPASTVRVSLKKCSWLLDRRLCEYLYGSAWIETKFPDMPKYD